MTSMMWFLTRSSGIVALILILAAVADGLVFSARAGGRRRLRPAWWLDLHRGLGGYAMIFTGLHLLTSVLASDLGVGLAQVFVPGTSDYATGAFTWGVLSFYAMAVTVFSSWPKQLLRRRAWHAIHLLSLPAAVAALVHAYQLGSDARSWGYLGLFVLLIGVAMYPVGLRLSGLARRHLASAPSPAPASPTA